MYKNQDRSTKRENLSSFVQEFTLEDAAENDLFQNLIQIFKPTRKLKPNVVTNKKVSIGDMDHVNLTLHIMKGTNIPGRSRSQQQVYNAQQNMTSFAVNPHR